jgi:transketolase
MNLKRRIIDLSYSKQLSHIGSCLSCVDLIDAVYNFKKPGDKFVMDNGHAHLAHLVVMEKYGVIKNAEKNLKFGIHCDRKAGCDVSTGSLGQGIAISLGLAVSDRSKSVFCMVSEGSSAEGSFWESLRLASELKLDNLKLIFNANGYNALAKVDTDLLIPRINSFGWAVIKLDDKVTINHALELGVIKGIPLCIFCPTNNGLPILEGVQGHYKVLNQVEYEDAKKVL